ncbi:MAG: FHA domain-containing protein [Acidobacteriota bacterium]
MRAELSEIDLSPIGELVRIRKEETILEERLAKMEAKNEKVSPVVYARVKGDYEARRNALAKESQPLKEKAHREYQRLKILRAEVERAVEAVSLEKEELEFRKDLGEFVEDEFKKRLSDCEKRLAAERQELEGVLQMRNTFAGAFRSDDELESGALPAPPAPPLVAPGPPAAEEAPPPDATVVGGARPPVGAAPPPLPAVPNADATVMGPVGATVIGAAGGPPVSHSATIVLPRARLSLLEGETPVKEFVLKPGASVIGRLAQSDIQLPSTDVSRRHAQVTFGPEGCFVSDLGSENGVAVNGKRIERHRLEDGDVIALGKQRLLFRA